MYNFFISQVEYSYETEEGAGSRMGAGSPNPHWPTCGA
jgi:hypothetical protein